MIERNHLGLSVGAQCRLLSILRSSFHSKPQGETEMTLGLMQLIDKKVVDCPFLCVSEMVLIAPAGR